MKFKSISVLDYVADDFNKPLQHPNPKPDSVERSLQRTYKLINIALSGIKSPEWEVNEGQYASAPMRNEPYGMQRADDKFVIYGEERGQRRPLAIFKRYTLAAEYFAWLVSNGSRTIDWSLHLEMEP